MGNVRGYTLQLQKTGRRLNDLADALDDALEEYGDELNMLREEGQEKMNGVTYTKGSMMMRDDIDRGKVGSAFQRWSTFYLGMTNDLWEWRKLILDDYNENVFDLWAGIETKLSLSAAARKAGMMEAEDNLNRFKRSAQAHDRDINDLARKFVAELVVAQDLIQNFRDALGNGSEVRSLGAWHVIQKKKFAAHIKMGKAILKSGYLDMDRMINDFNAVFKGIKMRSIMSLPLVRESIADQLIAEAICSDPAVVVDNVFTRRGSR